MTFLQALLGLPTDTRLLVGVEEDPCEGGVIAYLNARYTGLHTHVTQEGVDAARRAWGAAGHVWIDVPTEALCNCDPTGGDSAGVAGRTSARSSRPRASTRGTGSRRR